MCQRCTDIDMRIGFYQAILSESDDRFTVVSVQMLIEDLNTEKAEIHPQSDQPSRT